MMSMISPEKLKEIIESHGKWLRDEPGGSRANLSGANLSGANLSGANLSGANLSGANLSGAYLSDANLSDAYLSDANLSGANLSGANLSGANLSGANLSDAYLSGANLSDAYLSDANLSGANLSGANLSGAVGLPDMTKQFDFLQKLERTSEGYICYKTFGEHYKSPDHWKIEDGSILDEFTDLSPHYDCSYGINVATMDWVKRQTSGQIWKCLIRFEWLVGAVIPMNTDGKFRTSRVQLIEKIQR
jgi:hypothetical protein